MAAACFVFHKPPVTKATFGILFLLSLTGFLINALAPGTALRQAAFGEPEYAGLARIAVAIADSFRQASSDIDTWLLHDFRILAALLFLTPVFYRMAEKTSYPFKYPLWVVLFSFCLYAAEYAPEVYVMRGLRLTRSLNIIYFAFVLLVFLNYFYLVGYMARLVREGQISFSRGFLVRCAYMACAFALVFVFCSASRYRSHTSIIAARELRHGTAQQYSREMNERYKILHDDSIKQVEFPPLSVGSELLYAYIIGTDRDHWVNRSAAQFYHKEYVIVNEDLH
jgi:hypothetical protein